MQHFRFQNILNDPSTCNYDIVILLFFVILVILSIYLFFFCNYNHCYVLVIPDCFWIIKIHEHKKEKRKKKLSARR